MRKILLIISLFLFFFSTATICVAGSREPLPQKILILSSESGKWQTVCIDQMFRQLGVFWKIPVDIIDIRDASKNVIFDDNKKLKYCMIVISAIVSGDVTDIEQSQWDMLEQIKENIPLVTFYKAANGYSDNISSIWGVESVSEIKSNGNVTLVIDNLDSYAKNLPCEIIIGGFTKYFYGNLVISDGKKLIYNDNYNVVVRKGLSLYCAVDPSQLGKVSFEPFFKIIEDIIFDASCLPHFALGGYGSLRIDDFPSQTEELYSKWKKGRPEYLKRVAIGIWFISPLISITETIVLLIGGYYLLFKRKKRVVISFIIIFLFIIFAGVQYCAAKDLYLEINDLSISDKLFFKGYDVVKSFKLDKIQKSAQLYKTKLEYMVTSHILFPDGRVYGQEKLFPLTIKKMQILYKRHQININAHGRTHINEKKYFNEGVINAQEYIGLDFEQTQESLKATIAMIQKVFGKYPKGFVAPAWGYQKDVTKEVASHYFDYIVDKNSFYLQSREVNPFGEKNEEKSYVNAPETWEYGMQEIDESDPKVWDAFLNVGFPVHFMMHSPTCDTQRKGLVDICKAGTDSGVKWIYLEDLVTFANEYYNMQVYIRFLDKKSISYLISCPQSMSQEFLLISDKKLANVKIDGQPVVIDHKIKAWIPRLDSGNHELAIKYD